MHSEAAALFDAACNPVRTCVARVSQAASSSGIDLEGKRIKYSLLTIEYRISADGPKLGCI